MLSALKKQLLFLSTQPEETIAKRFRHFPTYQQAVTSEVELKNFILCLPDLLQQINSWIESPEVPKNIKQLYWYLMTYLYHSLDVLPEEEFGFWGYLDDAYFAGLAYQKILNEYRLLPAGGQSPSTFASQIEGWLQKTRQVLPTQTETLDLLFAKLLMGQKEAFVEVLS